MPIYVSATYIFLFILFGSFLERAGMIRLFTDVSLGLFGGTRGGPAKVAVFASGMMGTISGSGVANVVTVGQFTIPLMIRFGYRRAFAAGVEATASMGGQIMPPVMGAVAFIMAETLGVDYSVIVKAAVIPAMLYFASAFWMVHLEAGKHGLVGMTRAEIPSAWQGAGGALVPGVAAGGTGLHAVRGLHAALCRQHRSGADGGADPRRQHHARLLQQRAALRVLDRARAGGRARSRATASRSCRWPVVVGVLVLIAAITRGGRATLAACRDSLADSAKSALTVGMACAIVGSIIGMMTQTGVGTIFGGWIIGLGDKSLFLALVMTMLLSILLGTGIPTIPTYIITAALAAPALAKLGVPLIASHMFAFYYGIMADLSPPVALAALAAAPIAKENPDKIGWEAMRIALAGYVIPFIFVYSPALMLQAGDPMAAELGFYGAVAFATFKALVAIGLFGMVAIGFLFTRLTLLERVVGLPRGTVPARRFSLQRQRGLYPRDGLPCCGNGGSDRAAWRRRLEPVPHFGRRREDAVARGFHAGMDPFDREVDWQEDWRVTPQGSNWCRRASRAPAPAWSRRRRRGWSMAGFNGSRERAPMHGSACCGNSGAAGEWQL